MGRNMGSLMFMVAGLLFVGISILAKKTREKFIAESFLVTGKIVDIKESRQRSGGASTVFYLPIIEYKADSVLRFQAEIDADQHSLQVGEFVDVLVSKANHKVAKLKKSTKEVFLLLNLMLFLGVVACGLSVYLFYISDVDFSIDPFIAGIAAMSIASVLFSLSPMIKNVIDRGPSYVENAYEVAEDNS